MSGTIVEEVAWDNDAAEDTGEVESGESITGKRHAGFKQSIVTVTVFWFCRMSKVLKSAERRRTLKGPR